MKRPVVALPFVVALAIVGLERAGGVAALPACDPDNGGITLPQGLCAAVVAEGLGYARHIAVAANGDLYVGIRGGGGARGGPPALPPGVAALRDTNGDGKMDVTERFRTKSTNAVVLHNGYLYIGHTTGIDRCKVTPGELKPAGDPEVVVEALPQANPHQDKGIAFDGKGGV